MSIPCSISVLKVLPRTMKNIIFDSKVTCKPFTLLEEFPFGFLSSFLCIACHCRNFEVIIRLNYLDPFTILLSSFMVHS